jgi:hypothetical protein
LNFAGRSRLTFTHREEDYPDEEYPEESRYPEDAEYLDHIEELRNKFSELIPGSTDSVQVYRAKDERMDERVVGNIAIQFSPYDHDGGSDGRTPQARVRIFCEGRQEPVIDRSWDSQFASGTAGETGSKLLPLGPPREIHFQLANSIFSLWF